MNGIGVTLVGNLTKDPELRKLPSGDVVLNMRVASNSRKFDRDASYWVDDDPVFLNVECWDDLATNCAQSLVRGSRVIVTGKLKQREFEDNEGRKNTVYEIRAEDVALSLRFHSIILEDAQG